MSLKNPHNPDLLKKAEKIYTAALDEVDPENIIKRNVTVREEKLIIQDKGFDLNRFDNIFLVAIGKAAPFMARSLLEILGDKIEEGVVLYLPQHKIDLKNITCLPAPHPLPDERSVSAARSILNLAKKVSEKDLLIVLISGGGSAQTSFPAKGISIEEKSIITNRLLKAGADIKELNTVRKHLSQIKGGRLAQAGFPGTIISLVLSDVINNDLESIASGPVYWDSSTYGDALQVLRKYNLWDSAPYSIKKVIEKGIKRQIKETIKKGDQAFSRVSNFIIGDNKKALQAARREAERLGFESLILTSSDKGEARDAARNYVSLLRNILQSGKARSFPLCLLAGGELTVSVKGKGEGGRNQEFVLAVLVEIKNRKMESESWLILSLGSDGIDGPTNAAGAWIVQSTLERVQTLSLVPESYLDRNDSYNFFKQAGGLIFTGPTHTNVMDIRVFLIDYKKGLPHREGERERQGDSPAVQTDRKFREDVVI